jgi:putative restriction endonuclease
MKSGQRLWTREELLLAINLYTKIPFGQFDQKNRDVKQLAALLDRTPSSIARRLGNFASLDPVHIARGITGLSNTGNLAQRVWTEFNSNWDSSFEESERLLARYRKVDVEQLYEIVMPENVLGIDRKRLVNVRMNQYRFRQLVMSNYNYTCCITGIRQPELLIASHITPWSQYKSNRLNPANGLCLNALHDKAFDTGLLTVSAKDYTIQISKTVRSIESAEMQDYFQRFEGKEIMLPKKFMPGAEFLEIHNENFRRNMEAT